MRAFFLPLMVAVAPLTAHALEVPKFKSGGFQIHLQWALGRQHADGESLQRQVIPAGFFFANELPNEVTPAGLGLRLAYNILGFVSVGVDFTGTGWDVTSDQRGGAGFLVGMLAVHPLQFVFINKEERPIGLDISTHFGGGYGIVGVSQPAAMGMDGPVLQWGFNVDYFFTKHFGVEFFTKSTFLMLNKFYLDWDGAHRNPPTVGSSATIENRTPAGTWWHFGFALVLRLGD
jgi:hypothetical protein